MASNSRLKNDTIGGPVTGRLSKAQRRRQLLDTALMIVRDEGADRLTLGHLAERAGVSKPVAYDHFGTRSGLLIELYRSIDLERANALGAELIASGRNFRETVESLAECYMNCVGDTTDEWHAIGAALGGSEEKAAVYQELLDNTVHVFASVLKAHSDLSPAALKRICIGLVGAGEAISAAMVRDKLSRTQAVKTLAILIRSGITQS